MASNVIDYITIASTGNAVNFGDLNDGKYNLSSAASGTRSFFMGGNAGSIQNVINFVTISSTGDTTNFGDLLEPYRRHASSGNSTRIITFGGRGNTTGFSNVIQYFTTASSGDAIDFGDLSSTLEHMGSFSSTVKAMSVGGNTNGGSTGQTNVIEEVTIASTGNATDFGDLVAATFDNSATSNGHGGLS